jgi:hypothetical protein
MPNPDPTGRGHAVALSIPATHAEFLRRTFSAVQSGLLDDLASHPERLRDPACSRREADAFGRLLAAIDTSACVRDAEVCSVLGDLARSVDEANEYERVTAEHAALRRLIDQLDSASSTALGRKES